MLVLVTVVNLTLQGPTYGMVVVGSFDQPAGNIARYDGTAWRGWGGGVSGSEIRAAATVPNSGSLSAFVIAGTFTSAAGNPATNVAFCNYTVAPSPSPSVTTTVRAAAKMLSLMQLPCFHAVHICRRRPWPVSVARLISPR